LLGHLDYIRTVQFHHEYPWILSASDDQTIRIWNWQSRTCIAVLTGHNHYVMCAAFHPKEDLVVSASLDQTVRIWDTSGLRNKNVTPGGGFDEGLRLAQNDLFGNPNVVVKYVLEGHDRGVNWAAFHPTLPLIISGADDRYVKLWRMNDTKAWEVDTCRGHYSNVSCVIFHPHQELILSNSEDKTIRVWDMSKRTGVQTFRRESDRFWILAAHPHLNLFAAGHDSGLIVFKLERERPAYTVHKSALLYVRDRYLRAYDYATSRDAPVMSVRRSISANKTPRLISYSSSEKAVLICTDADGGSYELYKIPTDGRNDSVESKKGSGKCAVFVKRDRFAVLDYKSQTILLNNLQNRTTKTITKIPMGTDYIFSAGISTLLLRTEDKIHLFDVRQERTLAEISASNIKFVFFSEGKNGHVALMGRDVIIICTKKLEQLCVIHETIRLKSGAWDENGVFVYTTLNHIKYCLINGDHGIIRTLDVPIYITAVQGNKIFCLDREVKHREVLIDTTEYMFKLALLKEDWNKVFGMVRPGHSNLVGQSIIAYLQRKGYPEVALLFVKDEKTKFNLALECGNIEVAVECAKSLNDKDCWQRLGGEALRQGNHQVVEMAYQRTQNFERLSFLYLITGNTEKLSKMLQIAEYRNDTMSQFHNALYLGDVSERIRILESVGQLPLAYITASTHGLEEKAAEIAEKLGDDIPDVPTTTNLLIPPTPVMRLHETNWPLLTVSEGNLKFKMDGSSKFVHEPEMEEEISTEGGWGEEGDLDLSGDENDPFGDSKPLDLEPDLGDLGGSGWGDDDDALAGLDDIADEVAENFTVLPRRGDSPEQRWIFNSTLAVDHIAAGSFETAMDLLNQQVGIVNFAPLKEYFMETYIGAHSSLPYGLNFPSTSNSMTRNEKESVAKGLPALRNTLQYLIDLLKSAYRDMTKGAFPDARNHFLYIMHNLLFVVVDNKQARNEVKELLFLCKEYVVGITIELQKKKMQGQPLKQLELAAYFTHCKLQAIHRMLSIRSAMKAAYRLKNFLTAASLARRLLELSPKPEIANEARKVIRFAETNSTNAHQLNYDERNPFVVCAKSFTPIYKNQPRVDCPYCESSYMPDFSGSLCSICELAEIGMSVTGMKVSLGRN